MNPEHSKDREEILKYIEGVLQRVISRLQTDHRQNTRLIGQVLTSGCELDFHRMPGYTRQFDFLLLEKKAFRREGKSIGAFDFFQKHLGGLTPGVVPLLDAILNKKPPGEPSGLYSIEHPDARELTHQAKILYHLCSSQPHPPHLLCYLPHGSGRTSAAFLAAMQILTTRMGSVLYIAPTARAARLIASRANAFLADTGWSNAITLGLLIEKSPEDHFAGLLSHIVWNDLDEELINCRERPEIFNIVITVPEYLERLILQEHRYYKEFLADLQMIVLDSADRYFGTYGSHVSLILRRLRRLLRRYGAEPRTLTTIAPYENAPNHVRRLFGFDDDRSQVVREITEVKAGEDAAPWPEKMAATWTPPLRFREIGGLGADPALPIVALATRPKRLSSRDGLTGLLSALAHGLSAEPHPLYNPSAQSNRGTKANKILVLAREEYLTEDDLRGWSVSGYSPEIIHSLNELDAEHLDARALVVFGHIGSWFSFVHQVAHFGENGALVVLASGSDAMSRDLIRNADSVLETFKAGARGFFDAESALPMAEEVLKFSQEKLEIAPDNPEILKLHLYLAASLEGGITESEAEHFFGGKALSVLELLKEEFTGFRKEQVGSGGLPTSRYYIDTDMDRRPRWDPLCVSWDRPGGGEALVPIRVTQEGGSRPISYLERPLLHSVRAPGAAPDQFGTMIRSRRRLIITRSGEEEIKVQYGNSLEYRPRLSRLEIERSDLTGREEITLVITNQDPARPSGHRLDMHLTVSLEDIRVREQLVGRVQADGYATDDLNVIRFDTAQPECMFKTKGLFLRFDDMESPDFAFLHSLAHLIKICLPLFLRYSPEELEVRVCPETIQKGSKPASPWHIVIFDNHPEGTCYASALASYPAEWWKRLFESCYRILQRCPCVEGCWQCMKVFECRELHELSSNNQQLDKKAVFEYLGQRFDERYLEHWALKSGRPPSQLEPEQYEAFVDGWIQNHRGRVIKVLRDKCTFEIMSDSRRAKCFLDAMLPTPGVYIAGENRIYLWPPSKGLREQDYIYLLAHEYAHNWQFTSGRFHRRLRYYNYDNVADPDNIPFRGRLFVEGCARWAEVQICDHFGLDAHMIEIRNNPQFSEYELGYKLFLFLEYHTDFARLVDFLQTAEILIRLPKDEGWQRVARAADYVHYLYDDSRLAILGSMIKPAGPKGRCLATGPESSATSGGGDMLFQEVSKATYLGVSQDSDCRVDEDGNEHPEQGEFIRRLKEASTLGFNPKGPIAKILAMLDRETKKALNFQCSNCQRNGSKEPMVEMEEDAVSSGAAKKTRACSIFDACHLHSSGATGRSTTELLRAISEALRKKTREPHIRT